MTLSTAPAAANFDRVARLYRWAEYLLLGPLLQCTRIQLLDAVSAASHVLALGDGDGRFLERLLREAPEMEAVALDSSAKMLRLLGSRCSFAGHRLQTRLHSFGSLPKDLDLGQTDLVVTHFFLDCLTQRQVNDLAEQLASRLAPGALWLVSDFAYLDTRPWKFVSRRYIRLLYFAFARLTGLRVRSLPAIAEALSRVGFQRRCRHERAAGLLFSELWQLPTRDAR